MFVSSRKGTSDCCLTGHRKTYRSNVCVDPEVTAVSIWFQRFDLFSCHKNSVLRLPWFKVASFSAPNRRFRLHVLRVYTLGPSRYLMEIAVWRWLGIYLDVKRTRGLGLITSIVFHTEAARKRLDRVYPSSNDGLGYIYLLRSGQQFLGDTRIFNRNSAHEYESLLILRPKPHCRRWGLSEILMFSI